MGDEEDRTINYSNYSSSSSGCSLMNSSNIGYKLLKKQGWVEGTGLGASLQGRLEPVVTHHKKNKKGLGADSKPKVTKTATTTHNKEPMSKKEKALSKRMRKMLEEEKRRKEKEFDQAFFREFWPDNV